MVHKNYSLSLNSNIKNLFKRLTNVSYDIVLTELLTAYSLDVLIDVATKLNLEQIDEVNNETMSGVVNYLLSEILEALTEKTDYNGRYLDLIR